LPDDNALQELIVVHLIFQMRFTFRKKGRILLYSLVIPWIVMSVIGIILFALNANEMFVLWNDTISQLQSALHLYFTENKNVRLIVGLIFILSIIFGAIIVFGLSHIRVNRKATERRKENKEKYQHFLSGVIAQEVNIANQDFLDKTDYTHLSFKDLFEPECRKDLLAEIKSLHEVIVGKERERLTQLYKALGFVDELKNRMDSDQWIDKVEIINEIKQFKLKQYTGYVKSCVNDKDNNVANVAFSAMVEEFENPLDILELIEGPLNRWEKHVIYQNLKSLKDFNHLDFLTLLRQHPNHVSFLIDVFEKLSIDFTKPIDEKSKYKIAAKSSKPKDPLNLYSTKKEQLAEDLRKIIDNYTEQTETEKIVPLKFIRK